MEQKAEYNRKYRRQYLLDEKTRNGLGSGFLGSHMYEDEDDELRAVQRELKRLRLN